MSNANRSLTVTALITTDGIGLTAQRFPRYRGRLDQCQEQIDGSQEQAFDAGIKRGRCCIGDVGIDLPRERAALAELEEGHSGHQDRKPDEPLVLSISPIRHDEALKAL